MAPIVFNDEVRDGAGKRATDRAGRRERSFAHVAHQTKRLIRVARFARAGQRLASLLMLAMLGGCGGGAPGKVEHSVGAAETKVDSTASESIGRQEAENTEVQSGAEQGASAANEIVLGMSTALSGPAAELGQDVRAGVRAALGRADRLNLLEGRKVRLIALDDGYEPQRTPANMLELIDQDRVLAVIGNVGTPTAIAALPIVNQRKVLFYAAYTGAGVLRKNPPDRYVINYRASYNEEVAAMLEALLDGAGLSIDEIAFFTQRDGYGDAGFSAALSFLKRRRIDTRRLLHTRYKRNTVAVANSVADVLSVDPPLRAVVMVGAYAPCAAFVRLCRENDFDPIFLILSFVGSRPLAERLGADGDGVIVTQVVPPYESDLPIVAEYRDDQRNADPKMKLSFGGLEGYIAARILLRALGPVSSIPGREEVVDALEGLGEFEIGLDVPLRIDGDHHQACDRVWPTILRGGKFTEYSWDELPSHPSLEAR